MTPSPSSLPPSLPPSPSLLPLSPLQLVADHVVIAVGLEPNTDLADSARLEVDNQCGGFKVNSELQACTDVWAVS